MAHIEKLPVKVGLSTLPVEMSAQGALRWARYHIPHDLKRAGFEAFVSVTDPEMHGGRWLRVNYGKRVSW